MTAGDTPRRRRAHDAARHLRRAAPISLLPALLDYRVRIIERKEVMNMKRFVVREVEPLKTTAAMYGACDYCCTFDFVYFFCC
jgi:hypothetical protein